MPDPFLTIKRETGEYLSRADVNKLDADTAHVHQSIADWSAQLFGQAATLQPALATPLLAGVTTCAASSIVGAPVDPYMRGTNVGLNGLPILPSTQYTILVGMSGPAAGPPGQAIGRQHDAAGVSVGGTIIGDLAPFQGDTTTVLFAVTFVSEPDAAFLEIRGTIKGTATDGDRYEVLGAMVAVGADPTFVPSIRIVGDIHSTIDCVIDDYSLILFQFIYGTDKQAGPGRSGFYMDLTNAATPNFRTNRRIDATTAQGLTAPWGLGVNGQRYVFDYQLQLAEGGQDILTMRVDGDALPPVSLAAEGPTFYSGVETFQFGVFGSPNTGSNPPAGSVFSCELRDGIDGPLVYRLDAADVLAAI